MDSEVTIKVSFQSGEMPTIQVETSDRPSIHRAEAPGPQLAAGSAPFSPATADDAPGPVPLDALPVTPPADPAEVAGPTGPSDPASFMPMATETGPEQALIVETPAPAFSAQEVAAEPPHLEDPTALPPSTSGGRSKPALREDMPSFYDELGPDPSLEF